jgi:serine/threonine protein kinase
MQPGQLILGEFLLQRLLSENQTGAVWRALEINVGRLVLLHFIPDSFRTLPPAMQRLQRHFIAVQKLKHPHIVSADRLVDHSASGAFFVSRFVEGLPLHDYAAQWIQAEERFPFHLIFEVLRPVALALEEAKTQNIAHRSLSPRMIVVSPAEGIQIQGFDLPGIIREGLNPADDPETIRYLAPEQLLNRKAGALSDQYAFAMIIAELLANKVLFPAGNTEEFRTKILTTPPPMLPNYPDCVNASLQRALHRDPAVRFPSCLHFLDGLAGLIPVDFPPLYKPTAATVPITTVPASTVLVPTVPVPTVQELQSTIIPVNSIDSIDSIYALSVRKAEESFTTTTTQSVPFETVKVSVWDMLPEKTVSFKKIAATARFATAKKIVSKIQKERRVRFLLNLWKFLFLIGILIGIYFLWNYLAQVRQQQFQGNTPNKMIEQTENSPSVTLSEFQ